MGIDDWQERHCLCPSTLLHHYLEVSIVIARSRSNDPSAAQGDSICDVLITPGQISMTGSREACGAVPATSSRRTSACPHGRFPWLSLVCNQPLRLTSSWTAIYRLLQRIASLVGRPSLHRFQSRDPSSTLEAARKPQVVARTLPPRAATLRLDQKLISTQQTT